ncbi:MAG: molybdenum cofactor guanylyltransferase [Candidatus Helarchaeota archaeon]
MEQIAGVILSGGLARRFQSDGKKWIDKAIVKVEGTPILVHTIEILKEITDEILIIVNNMDRKKNYEEILKNYKIDSVKIYIDEKNNCKGPLLGIVTAVKKVKRKYCLVLPCDLPFIKVQTLNLLIRNLAKKGITLFIHNNGEIEPLPTCISVEECLEIIKLACRLGKRRIDDIYRGYTELSLVPTFWFCEFDPQLKSLVNLNYPNDLSRDRAVIIPEETIANSWIFRTNEKINDQLKSITKSIDHFDSNDLNPILKIITNLKNKNLLYWIATFYEFLGRHDPKYFKDAAEYYLKEANFYSKKRLTFLQRHAKSDHEWCLQQISDHK